jgi:hypothetical protein
MDSGKTKMNRIVYVILSKIKKRLIYFAYLLVPKASPEELKYFQKNKQAESNNKRLGELTETERKRTDSVTASLERTKRLIAQHDSKYGPPPDSIEEDHENLYAEIRKLRFISIKNPAPERRTFFTRNFWIIWAIVIAAASITKFVKESSFKNSHSNYEKTISSKSEAINDPSISSSLKNECTNKEQVFLGPCKASKPSLNDCLRQNQSYYSPGNLKNAIKDCSEVFN